MVVSPSPTSEEQTNHTQEIDGAADGHVRKKRFLPFLFGVSAIVSAVISTANIAFTVSQLNNIRSKLQLLSHTSQNFQLK